jgi:ABC-type sugar transport system permease subunit
MVELVGALLRVAAAIGLVLGIFVGANALVDQAPRRFAVFAVGAGALVGAFLGAIANSGGWFGGGVAWPLGGAVLGALLGWLWSRRPPPLERRRRIPDALRPFIFVAPAILFLAVTLIIPTLRTLYLSLRSKRGEDFVGFDNYESIFGDNRVFNADGLGDILTSRLFIAGVIIIAIAIGVTVARDTRDRRSVDLSAPGAVAALIVGVTLALLAGVGALRGVIWNNFFWVVFVTGVSTVLGLAIAVLADRSRGEAVAKSLIFMPMAISFVGASVIFRFVYAFTPAGRDQIGIFNAVWVGMGGEPEAWIQKVPWNNLLLIAIMIWIQTGFAMVVLSAAIKAVPEELHEASRIDGATEVQTFWRVTVPQIRTTIGVVIVTLIITVLKVYDIVKVMTNGEFSTDVIASRMFNESFINRDYGRGSALAALLFLAVLPLMIINVVRSRRQAFR